ncbi:MAG TPA: hypothetical protein VKZ43_02265 [Trueperaceae bacterium]|nr:hypothetical protein [Trueperaceae bacterium]
MDLLSSIPVWVYYVILVITFMGAHVLAFSPSESGRKSAARGAMRIGSSVLLLIGLVLIQPQEPGSILMAVAAAALGGFVSGKAAPPVRQLGPSPDTEKVEPGSEQSTEE